MKILINLYNFYIFEAAFNKQFANLIQFIGLFELQYSINISL